MFTQELFDAFFAEKFAGKETPTITDYFCDGHEISFAFGGPPHVVNATADILVSSGPILENGSGKWIPVNAKISHVVNGTSGFVRMQLHPSPF